MVRPKKALSNYEEERSKRLEANQKKMEELKLGMLSQALRKPIAPKTSPMKKKKVKQRTAVDLTAVRRSSRVAYLPPTSYKEVQIEGLGKRIRCGGKPRDLSMEGRENATERAYELEADLNPDIPSFVKSMLPSHVTHGFWLGLPLRFCKKHLPKHDATITLVTEDREKFETNYVAKKTGLSGGWREFAIHHDLVDGDACVFQLTKPTVFRVYILRLNVA